MRFKRVMKFIFPCMKMIDDAARRHEQAVQSLFAACDMETCPRRPVVPKAERYGDSFIPPKPIDPKRNSH